MARRDLSNKDFSDHASGELDNILRKQSDEKTAYVPTVTAEQAMAEERVLQHTSARDVTRVLFISRNTELLNPTQQTLDGYLNISEVFDEVHILVLRQGIEPRQPVFRPDKNVFIYTVATRYWWQMPIAGIDMIKSQLVFASGFRPDLIVARDPFESAVVALWAARKFNRPTQLHVLVNYFHPSYLELAKPNRWRKFLAYFTVTRFLSVRASTTRILSRLRERTDIIDLARLPQLNPYETLAVTPATLDLKELYPQYVFTILFVDALQDTTAAFKAIDAARYMLRNPKICLIIFGNGPARSECAKRVKILGIEEQVIFEHRTLNHVPYLQAADLLIATNTTDASEEVVLQAAGAGIPMVMVTTDRRADVFTHRESAYLCEPDDVQAHSDGVHELMNNYELRSQITEQARAVVTQQFHQDPAAYRRKYRESIESALFAKEQQYLHDQAADSSATSSNADTTEQAG